MSKNKYSFDILSVKCGRNKNWLQFETIIGNYDKNKTHTFEYCGTEISPQLPISDIIETKLKECLDVDFGFPPYDIEECKRILGERKKYLIEE